MPTRPFNKALVTGAAGDLGGELCRCLAAAGIDLVVTDVDAVRLQQNVQELNRYPGCVVTAFTADLTDLESLETVLRGVAEDHPDIDLLIANAGIDKPGPIESFDWRTAKLHFDINTLANYVMFSVFVPRFLARGSGHVAAVISLGGLIGAPYEHAYSGSKAAMRMLMDGLRTETRGRGVTFSSIFPSYLEGRMAANNQFNVRKAVPMRVAAEKITAAILRRKPILKFPRLAALRVSLADSLPVALRDRLLIREMKEPTR